MSYLIESPLPTRAFLPFSEHVDLTRYAFKWVQTAPPPLKRIFIQRMKELSGGKKDWVRAKKLSKVLQGQRHCPHKVSGTSGGSSTLSDHAPLAVVSLAP